MANYLFWGEEWMGEWGYEKEKLATKSRGHQGHEWGNKELDFW